MQPRFIQLAIVVRRLVTRGLSASVPGRRQKRLTGRRQVGSDLTQFSFRLAFAIDVAYVGIGALGGAAVGRSMLAPPPVATSVAATCADSVTAGAHVR